MIQAVPFELAQNSDSVTLKFLTLGVWADCSTQYFMNSYLLLAYFLSKGIVPHHSFGIWWNFLLQNLIQTLGSTVIPLTATNSFWITLCIFELLVRVSNLVIRILKLLLCTDRSRTYVSDCRWETQVLPFSSISSWKHNFHFGGQKSSVTTIWISVNLTACKTTQNSHSVIAFTVRNDYNITSETYGDSHPVPEWTAHTVLSW